MGIVTRRGRRGWRWEPTPAPKSPARYSGEKRLTLLTEIEQRPQKTVRQNGRLNFDRLLHVPTYRPAVRMKTKLVTVQGRTPKSELSGWPCFVFSSLGSEI